MDLFTGRVALVTGGAAGIGQAAAILFAKHGARVAISDLDRERTQETIDRIVSAGGEAIFVGGNLSQPEVVRQMVADSVKAYGRLDCAFNNAGITHPHDHEWDDLAFQQTLDINVTAVMQCMKYQIPEMLKVGKGAIVNTSSVNGLIGSGNPSLPAYTASKHAVVGLTKTVALTYAKQGIRVNAVLPGVTMTNMVRGVLDLGQEVVDKINNVTPMGRMAEPEEIAEGAIWLCSDKASYVTGHSLVIDGGMIAQ